MKDLKTLILMQLKDKIDFSFIKSVKETIFKIVLSILKFVLITGLIFVAFYVISFLGIVSTLPGIPQNFFTVLFTCVYIISIVVCIMGLVKSLYFSKDNQLLLTFPTSRSKIFVSKLIVYYLYELLRNIYFILPWFVAYGLINNLPIYFYLWLIVGLVLLTTLSVTISSFLSIPTMVLCIIIKQNKWLEYLLLVLVVTGVVYGLITIINAIPENFDLIGQWVSTYWTIQQFLIKFISIFVPFNYVAIAIIGNQYGMAINLFTSAQLMSLLGVILTICIVAALTYLLVKPLFFKMASSPFEYKKSKVLFKHANKKSNGFMSFVKKELRVTYRSGNKFYDLLTIVFGLPIAVLLLNRIFAAMDTRLAGLLMGVAFNILVILVIALSSNVPLSHVYSEEGASSYLLKTNPKPYLYSALAKIVLNIVAISLSILASVIIFTSFTNFTVVTKIWIYVFVEAVYLSHLFMSVDLDITKPQTAQYQTTGSHINNPNEIKSTIYGFIISALMAFFTYFLIIENQNTVWIKLSLIALSFLALRIWLFVSKVKVYFKERQ